MRSVDTTDGKGGLRREMRALRPGDVLRAVGYTSQALRLAALKVEEERRGERIIFAIDSFAGGGGPRRDRFVVCGSDSRRLY